MERGGTGGAAVLTSVLVVRNLPVLLVLYIYCAILFANSFAFRTSTSLNNILFVFGSTAV